MRWQSTAHKSENSRRERFATPLSVLGIFCSFVLVLMLLYPEQGLLGVLGGGDDAATIRYREALLRIRPNDNDLRLKVAGSLVRSGNNSRGLDVLSGFKVELSSDKQHLVKELRYMAIKNLFTRAIPGGPEWKRLHPQFLAVTADLGGANPPAWLLRVFAEDSRKAGDETAWQEFSSRAKASIDVQSAHTSENTDYRAIADRYFKQMKTAENTSRRREYFFSAVRTLQAGNLPQEAFDEGEKNLTGLESDRTTLVFLTKIALAAGRPEKAQRIIKKALGMENKRKGSGNS